MWRIQALARHSSNAILAYLEEANLTALRGLSTDAALGRSIESVRAELAVLTAEARADRMQRMATPPQKEATAAQAAMVTDVQEVLLPEDPAPENSPAYVVSTLPAGKVHMIDPRCSSMTFCRWPWRDSKHHIQAQSPQGFRPCVKCITKHSAAGAHGSAPSGSSSPSSESEP